MPHPAPAEAAPVAAAPVQRLAEPGPAVVPAPAAGPTEPWTVTVQRAESPPPPAASSAAPPAEGEPEALLARLYDPLLRRLKAELRTDRDRYGSLTDLRH
jgi:hypothetical protein